MSYSVRLQSIRCIEESDETSAADEPYVLVSTVSLLPPRVPVTFRYGEWPNFDDGETLELIGETPFWGITDTPSQAEDIFDPDNVFFVVSVMEHDEGPMDFYRGTIQAFVTTAVAASVGLPPATRVQRVVDAQRMGADLANIPTRDNHVGTQALRLDLIDLATPQGQHRDKKLYFDGGSNGKWELTFRLVHHRRFTFPAGARLATVSREPNIIDLFAVGQDNQLHANRFYGRWHGWYPLPGRTFDVGAHLVAVSRDPGHVEVWGVGQTGVVHGIWFRDGKWQGWFDLPGAQFPSGAPLAGVSRYKDLMEVWCVDDQSDLRHKWFIAGEGWQPEGGWGRLGGATFNSAAHIAAVSRSAFDMQIWVVTDDGPIMSNRWMPDAWQGWKPLGTEMFSPGTQLAAVVRKKRIPFPPERDQWGLPIDPDTIIPHVHVLAVDMNQNLRDFWYEGNEPRGWFQAGSETFNQGTSTAAVSREPESVDIWAVRPNGMLYYDQAVGSGWTGWNRIDQDNMQIAPPADVAAVSRADGFLDVFYIRGGFVQTNSLRDGTWQGQVPLAWTFVA